MGVVRTFGRLFMKRNGAMLAPGEICEVAAHFSCPTHFSSTPIRAKQTMGLKWVSNRACPFPFQKTEASVHAKAELSQMNFFLLSFSFAHFDRAKKRFCSSLRVYAWNSPKTPSCIFLWRRTDSTQPFSSEGGKNSPTRKEENECRVRSVGRSSSGI